MDESNLFFSQNNCDLLYKIIQGNVKMETQIDINKNQTYYKILQKMLNVIHNSTTNEERTLNNLNNIVINKTVPYFCDIVKKSEKQNPSKNLSISVEKHQTENNNSLPIDNFKNMMDQRNALEKKFLNERKISGLQNTPTRKNEIPERHLSIEEPFKAREFIPRKNNKALESFFDAGNQYTILNNLSTNNNENFKNDTVKMEEPQIQLLSEQQKAVIAQTATKEILVDYMICVDSKDASTNDTPWEFTVLLGQPSPSSGTAALAAVPTINLRNVVEVELISCILPKYPFEETNGNRYLILNIAELNSTIYGTNNALTQAFAILVPDKEYVEVKEVNLTGESEESNSTIMKYVLCKNLHPKKTYYRNPLDNLTQLTIKFMNPNGTQENDSAWSNSTWGLTNETNIMLKVTCKETMS